MLENIDFPCFLQKRDRRTDGQTDRPGYGDARTHLNRKRERREKQRQTEKQVLPLYSQGELRGQNYSRNSGLETVSVKQRKNFM